MNEKDKMLKGLLYNAEDSVLKQDRIQCKLLCQEYNKLSYDNTEKRMELLRNILAKTGKN